MGQGKEKEARATLAEYARRDTASVFLPRLLAAYFAANLQFDSAAAALRQLTDRSRDLNDQSTVAFAATAIALTQGQLAEAERRDGDLMAVSERRGLPRNYLEAASTLAQIQAVYHSNPHLAGKTLDDALTRYPLTSLNPLDRPYVHLAAAYAIANQPARARALLKDYESLVPAGVRRADASDPLDDLGSGDAATGLTALAEGRSQDAIAAFRLWWDASGCTNCAQAELGRAFDLTKQPDSALTAYQRAVEAPGGLSRMLSDQWNLARSYRRLGELYEDKGAKDRALDYYGRFVHLWRNADPELQPQVREVKERMAKLAGEPK
jgi:tetratricopeptide (TPR) repeat protein